MAPARAELGLEIALPELNGAQRQRRLIEGGAPREDVFAAMVRETVETYAGEVVA
jgi:glutamate---cysteine ligase / carboxylate-amine ligase